MGAPTEGLLSRVWWDMVADDADKAGCGDSLDRDELFRQLCSEFD